MDKANGALLSILSAAMRNALKRRVDMYLKDIGTLTHNVTSQDAYGGTVENQQAIESSIPVRIINAGDALDTAGIVGAEESLRDMFRIIARQGTGLTVDQQWIVNGVTYNVIKVITDLTDDLFESAIITRQR